MGQLTVSVLVELSEGSSKFGDLRLGDSGRYVSQRGLPEFGLRHVLLHVRDHLGVQFDEVVFLVPLFLDPGVLEGFIGG